jgi:hypothetical protein
MRFINCLEKANAISFTIPIGNANSHFKDSFSSSLGYSIAHEQSLVNTHFKKWHGKNARALHHVKVVKWGLVFDFENQLTIHAHDLSIGAKHCGGVVGNPRACRILNPKLVACFQFHRKIMPIAGSNHSNSGIKKESISQLERAKGNSARGAPNISNFHFSFFPFSAWRGSADILHHCK